MAIYRNFCYCVIHIVFLRQDGKFINNYEFLILEKKQSDINFPCNASETLIDKTLRKQFGLSDSIQYCLFDMKDEALIDISSLCYLEDNSNILIEINDVEKSSSGRYNNSQ